MRLIGFYLSIILILAFSCTPPGDILLKSGLEKAEKGDYKGAIQDYTAAIKADTFMAEAYSNRAAAKLKLRDIKGGKGFNSITVILPCSCNRHIMREIT